MMIIESAPCVRFAKVCVCVYAFLNLYEKKCSLSCLLHNTQMRVHKIYILTYTYPYRFRYDHDRNISIENSVQPFIIQVKSNTCVSHHHIPKNVIFIS